LCGGGGKECLELWKVCNGRKECPGGEDEVNCNKWTCADGYTKCSDGEKCIRSSSVCDGFRNECGDGLDEEEEMCKEWNCDEGEGNSLIEFEMISAV
jgi:integrin beta 2